MTDVRAGQDLKALLDRGEEIRFDNVADQQLSTKRRRWLIAATCLALPLAILAIPFNSAFAGPILIAMCLAWWGQSLSVDKQVVLTDRRLLYGATAGSPLESHPLREIAGITRLGFDTSITFIVRKHDGTEFTIGHFPSDNDFWQALPVDIQDRQSDALWKKFLTLNAMFCGAFLLLTVPIFLAALLIPMALLQDYGVVAKPVPDVVFWPFFLATGLFSAATSAIVAFSLMAHASRTRLSRAEAQCFLTWQAAQSNQMSIARRIFGWIFALWDRMFRRVHGL